MKIPILYFAITISFVINGCKKDDNDIDNNNNNSSGQHVNTTISGRIFDLSGNPVSGATVCAGTKTAYSDQFGIYLLSDVSVDKNRAVVTAVKTGFWKQISSVIPTVNSVNFCNMKLFSATTTHTVDAVTGGMVTLPDGSKIEFPANAFVTTSGVAYTGTVNITMNHLATDNPEFALRVPGRDLMATDANNKFVMLNSYGMLGATLSDLSGNTIQLATGIQAILTIPIATNQLSTSSSTIPLWHFDETTGLWKEEGSATKTGNSYVGNVSHFTWWNCDQPGQSAYLGGYVKDCFGNPVQGAQVNFNWSNTTVAFTDANGYYFIAVQANNVINVTAYFIQFSNTIQTGPYTAGNTAMLPDLILNNPYCPGTVTGTIVDCSNASSAATILCFDMSNNLVQYGITTNGGFNFPVPSGDYNLVAYNGTSGGTALATVQQGISSNIGNLPMCDTVPALIPLNNFLLTFTSPFGNFTTSLNISSCSVTNGIANEKLIKFQQYDVITGNTAYLIAEVPQYANGNYSWFIGDSKVYGQFIANGSTWNVNSDSTSAGYTEILNSPLSVAGNVNGNFYGYVYMTDNSGASIHGYLTATFDVYRNY